jgi:phage shock protein A
MGSVEDRQRLKEEYKEHYRAVRELRKKAAEVERTSSIRSALNNMNTDSLMDTFDEMLHKVREKIDLAEARLEVMLESREEGVSVADQAKIDDFERKEKARETLSKIRMEMGLLHSELDEQIAGIKGVYKSVGPAAESRLQSSRPDKNQPNSPDSVHKTIGPKNDS